MLANTIAITEFAIDFEAEHNIRPFHLTVSASVFDSIEEVAFGDFNAIKKVHYVTASGEPAELQIRKRTSKASRHLDKDILTISGTVTNKYSLGA